MEKGATEERMEGITDSIDRNLGKLREIIKDKKTWRAAVHGGHKESDTTEQVDDNNLRLCAFSARSKDGIGKSETDFPVTIHRVQKSFKCCFNQVTWLLGSETTSPPCSVGPRDLSLPVGLTSPALSELGLAPGPPPLPGGLPSAS